jgi:hypothetical protein
LIKCLKRFYKNTVMHSFQLLATFVTMNVLPCISRKHTHTYHAHISNPLFQHIFITEYLRFLTGVICGQ